MTRAYGTSSATTISYTYDDAGRKLSETDNLGHSTSYTYDAAGNLTGTSGVKGTFTYAYDNARNRISMTDGNGNTTGYQYDAHKRLIETDYPDGTKTTNAYDGPGNLIKVIDQASHEVDYSYDAANELQQVTQATSSPQLRQHHLRGLRCRRQPDQGALDLEHYLDVLEQKPGALRGSKPLGLWRAQGRWPESYDRLWELMTDRHGRQAGARFMVAVIRMGREFSHAKLEASVVQASPEPPAHDAGDLDRSLAPPSHSNHGDAGSRSLTSSPTLPTPPPSLPPPRETASLRSHASASSTHTSASHVIRDHDRTQPHSSRLLPAPIQDHATAPMLRPCAVPYRKHELPHCHTQDVLHVALTYYGCHDTSHYANLLNSDLTSKQFMLLCEPDRLRAEICK